jgi:hypothetical protein
VRETVSNREAYAVSGNYLGSVRAGGTRGMGVASYEVSALSDLSGAGVDSVTNSSQLHFATQFHQGATVNPDPVPPTPPVDLVNIAPSVPNVVWDTQQPMVHPNMTVTAGNVVAPSFTVGYAGLENQVMGISPGSGNSADIAKLIADLQASPLQDKPAVVRNIPPSKVPSTEPSKSKKRTKSKNDW